MNRCASQRGRSSDTDENPAIRHAYERYGAEEYYIRFGGDYRNPHEPAIRAILGEAVARWRLDLRAVLDLACGSGEVTLALHELGAARIAGMDPYTGDAYRRRTGLPAEPLSFEEIAAGALTGRRYSLIVCSFALYLVEPSRLPVLCYQLSRVADALLVLTPHKRPVLRDSWGWTLHGEMARERVRARYYSTVQ